MLIFLYGADTFRSQQRLAEIIKKFKKDKDPQDINTSIFDCYETAEILGAALATPFLADRRLVVVKNLLASKNPDLQEAFLSVLKDKKIPETNIVVFWEKGGEPKNATKTVKAIAAILQKEKYAQEFTELKGLALYHWIESRVKDRRGEIDAPALQFLAAETKGDIWQINSLLEQLLDYKDGEKIELADVNLFLDEKADENIFNLVDAIITRQRKPAYKMIQEQYRIGEDVQFIFAMLLRQFRILLQMRDLFDREDKMTSAVLAKKLNLHPFVVKKSLALIRQYNFVQLKKIYNDLLLLDRQIKTGRSTPELLLDLFVAKV